MGQGLLWCGLQAWSRFINWTGSGRVTPSPLPSVAHSSPNLLVAASDTLSPDEGWPATSVFNLFTHKKRLLLNKQWGWCCSTCSVNYIHICPTWLFVPVFIQSCPGPSIIHILFFELPVNPMSLYLKPKSSQLDALLRASKWQKTVIDTALPVISPVGLLRLLYDGQADLAGTERHQQIRPT